MKGKKSNWREFIFIVPSLLGVSVFVLVPFLDVIRRSFTNTVGTQIVGFKNYATLFRNEAFQIALGNTGRFMFTCIPLLLLLSLLAAILLNEKFTGNQIIKSIYLIPMAIPVACVVLVWRLLFDRYGLVNAITGTLGLTGIDWMNTKYSFYILGGSYIWKNLGYNIVLWLAGLSAISAEVYEAAALDGAGWWKKLLFITIPNLKGMFFTITILAILNSFKIYREAYLVAGDYPDKSIYMLQHTFNNWFRELSLDKLAAGAVVTAMVLFLLITLLQLAWKVKEE